MTTRKMKDSGIEWIGEIPEDWKLPKVKQLFSIGRGRVISQLDLEDTGYPVYSSQTKNNGCLGYISTYDFDRSQLTWTTDGANAGTVFLREGKHNCTNVCGTLTPKNDENSLLYLKYALEYIAIYHKRADINGFKIMNNEMAEIKVTLPSMPEQQKIADFLDEKCKHIDAVLEKTRASIEEYKQLKQSVITKAVTKGIRPNRPMKDSGIEWIGEIPEDWNIETFRHIFIERNEKNIPIKTEERLSLSIDKGVTLYAEKTTNLDRFKDDFTQYKLAHVGDFVLNSMNMIVGAVGVSKYYGCVSPAYYTYYNKCIETAYFYEYLFKTKVMNRMLYSLGKGIYAIERGDDRVNTCRLKVSKDDLKSLKLPHPPQIEQQEIVAYLDDKCSEIDKLIAKKEQLIEELETYKKSFIYEYVTGKKEVC